MPLMLENNVEAKVRALNTLCVRGLAPMFDEQSGLFCNRLVRTESSGVKREDLSPRYTLMTLLGLHRGEQFGLHHRFNSEVILNGLLNDQRWIDNIGDLGLLLWTCAQLAPERYAEVYRDLHAAAALGQYREAHEGRTMELSWFLAGLAHGALAGQAIAGLADLAGNCLEIIRKNQGRNGIFGHLGGGAGVTGAFRGRLGSFADQVYPIYAFSKYAAAFSREEVLNSARDCADTICAVQGSLGQWWWHYDSRSGRVVGHYPVYSVHQDAMAPMALFALGETSGKDYNAWIFKGLSWIYGDNELKFSLYDSGGDIIWRCLYLPKSATYLHEAANLLGFKPQASVPGGLRVRYECRPYHLGWALYAFASYGFETS